MRCGVDAIEINRCASLLANPRWLQRLFTEQERAYILANPTHALQRCAGRFAAKEALFKALSTMHALPFITFCRLCEILPHPSGPHVILHGKLQELCRAKISVSITHTRELAISFAIVDYID